MFKPSPLVCQASCCRDGFCMSLEAWVKAGSDSISVKCSVCRLGKKEWSDHVTLIVKYFSKVLGADYVVLGGGNAKKLTDPPQNASWVTMRTLS